MKRGLAITAIHLALVGSLIAKYQIDRSRLPRVWARTASVDPDHPLRGRYVSLRVLLDVTSAETMSGAPRARLSIHEGKLVGEIAPAGSVFVQRAPLRRGAVVWSEPAPDTVWTIADPIAFFIPEHGPDPSVVRPGEELWVELSVPESGKPRPIRLGVKKEGQITPLELR